MRKLFLKIHLWLSVPVGIVISIVCLSGAILVFESEAIRAMHPKIYHIEAPTGAEPLTPSQLVARITKQVPDSLHLASIELPASKNAPCIATFLQTGRKQLSVNPYTGEVNGWTESSAFFGSMRKLHRWLLNPPAVRGEMSAGKLIVGISTLLMVVILISGLVVWFPRTLRALRSRLKVAVSKGRYRFWKDSHIALGVYTFLPLLVMALTGLTWSFGWYRTAAYSLFGGAPTAAVTKAQPTPKGNAGNNKKTEGGNTPHHSAGRKSAPKAPTFNYAVWDKVLAQLTAHYPAYKSVTLSLTGAQVSRQSTMRRTDRITFNPQSGDIEEIELYENTPRQQRLRGWFYAFHTGSWGGTWTKLIYFLSALIGASLPLTGYYLWWKRASPKRRKRRK